MEEDPKQSSRQQFGTTMRIDLSPELLEDALHGKRKTANLRKKSQPMIRIPKARSEVAAAGGPDFHQLLQNIYDAAFVTETNGEIVLANLRANHFFKAEPGELMGVNILNLIDGVDESLLPTILETLQGNRFVLMQAYCVRLNETYFAAEISVNRLGLGGRDRLTFFVRDVTLRKEQEDRLRTGYAALQNASSGIAITGKDADIEYTNKAFLTLFGIADPSTGRNLRGYVCEPGTVEEIIETIERGETWAGELEMRHTDGSKFFAQTSVTANLNAEGQPVGMVLSVLDVTPQKLAQQQLERYASELRDRNTQMQDDLNVAGELHQAFLPEEFMAFPRDPEAGAVRLEFRHRYCPCGTIGGDFFDIRELSEHEVAIFISDVMGHGIRSALVVATIRGLLEQLRPLARDPGALMTELNETYTAIFQQMGGDVTFSTALYAVMDTRTGELRYANASHPAPYVLRRSTGALERLEGGTATSALGLFADQTYGTETYPMKLGDLLLLFTDGLSEVEAPGGELYDANRLDETLRQGIAESSAVLLDQLVADAQAFAGETVFEDDVCLVGMECLPPEPPDDAAG
jgi:sigma-B regulation protein RsbU (phosphoserine phosphatase)